MSDILISEIEKQIAWLEHIKPRITAPESVIMGIDQAIKSMGRALIIGKSLRPIDMSEWQKSPYFREMR